MFFLKKEEIKICGTTYPISNACMVDSFNCKMHLITGVCFQLSGDTVNNLDQDTYLAWKKEAVKALKEWDKMYLKHQKTINPEVLAIHMQAFKPLTEMWEANLNFHHINEMIRKGTKVPEFRFAALEEQFVLKMTRICEIFRDYGRLEFPFNIRQMLTVLKIPDWKEIHPFAFYLQPLEDALADVVKDLLDMQKAGHLRSKYIIPENVELQDKVIAMVRLDVTCQILMGDELKQDQLKFLYNVHKTIYDTGLKDTYVDAKKNEHVLAQVVPQLNALHSLINIMEIEDARQADVEAAAAKEKRRAELLATTGIDLDAQPEIEMPVQEEEKKKPARKKKEAEVDPEVLEAERRAKAKAEDIAKYGVSLNAPKTPVTAFAACSAPGSGRASTTRPTSKW